MSLHIHLNGRETEMDDVHTLSDLVVHLGYEGKRIAIEQNGDIVPKSLYENTRLNAGDRIEIVVAVGGG